MVNCVVVMVVVVVVVVVCLVVVGGGFPGALQATLGIPAPHAATAPPVTAVTRCAMRWRGESTS